MNDAAKDYQYADESPSHAHAYLLPAVEKALAGYFAESGRPRRVFDLGCGNGSVAQRLSGLGYEVSGVDPSAEGIAVANRHFPQLELQVGSAYDDLQARFGSFPAVYSLEVVEHVYNPRQYAATLFSLVESGGLAIVSTPYHGYLKNLAIGATGNFDHHFDPLWDHGHIKFWSNAKLEILMREAGFRTFRLQRVGRFAPLAKSVIVCAGKP